MYLDVYIYVYLYSALTWSGAPGVSEVLGLIVRLDIIISIDTDF